MDRDRFLLRTGGLAAACLLARSMAAPPTRAADAVHQISLAEARAEAARRSPDVVIAIGREEIARAQIDVAGALANPTVTVQTARQTARLGTALSLPLPL